MLNNVYMLRTSGSSITVSPGSTITLTVSGATMYSTDTVSVYVDAVFNMSMTVADDEYYAVVTFPSSDEVSEITITDLTMESHEFDVLEQGFPHHFLFF